LWGTTWTEAQVEASNFGIRLKVRNLTTSSRTASVDHVEIRVYYQPPPSTTIGSAGTPLASAQIAGTCQYFSQAAHAPCTSTDKVWAGTIGTAPQNLTKPAVDLDYWYENAKPGPMHNCTTGSFPGGFDTNSVRDNSVPGSAEVTPNNSSYTCQVHDVLGRYLMDHTIRVGAGGILEVAKGPVTSWDDGRANGIYIPRFRNLTSRRKDYIRGWGYQGSGTRGMFPNHARNISGFGAEYKKAVKNNWPYSVGIGGWGEMLARRENYVALNKEISDRWGIPALHIVCSHSENELNMAQDIFESAKEMLHDAGVQITFENRKLAAPGVCIHEIGTCRMGRDPKTSMLNQWNQMWDVKNVFVTDGASFTSSGCVNPTITMMALTARACAYIAEEMRKGNL
jgi:hypothetical protein